MVRARSAIGLGISILFLGGCFPPSSDGTGSMDPVPCGGTCVTAPEAPAAADGQPWGLYKAIRLDYQYTAAARMFVGQADPMTTSTCAGQAGTHELTCSLAASANGDRFLTFTFTDDSDMLWYPGTLTLPLNADGTVYNNYMALKETSTDLVQTFEGTWEGAAKNTCGALLQDGTLTTCCYGISQDLDTACFRSAAGSGAIAGTSCAKDAQGHATCPVPTTYTAGDTTFEGSLSGEILTGTWTNEAGSGTFELVRTR